MAATKQQDPEIQLQEHESAQAAGDANAGTAENGDGEEDYEQDTRTAERLRWQQWWQALIERLTVPPEGTKKQAPLNYYTQAKERETRKKTWHQNRQANADKLYKRAQLGEQKTLNALQGYYREFHTCDLASLQQKKSDYQDKMEGIYTEIDAEISNKLTSQSAGLKRRIGSAVRNASLQGLRAKDNTVHDHFWAYLDKRKYHKASQLIESRRAGRLRCWFGHGREINAAIDQMHKKITAHRGHAVRFDQASAALDSVQATTADTIHKLLKDNHTLLQPENTDAKKLADPQTNPELAFLMELASHDKTPGKKDIQGELETRLQSKKYATVSLPQLRDDLAQLHQMHADKRQKAQHNLNNYTAKTKAIQRFVKDMKRKHNKGTAVDGATQDAVADYTKKLAGRTAATNLPRNPLRAGFLPNLLARRPIILSRDFAETATKSAAPKITPDMARKPLEGLNKLGQRAKQAVRTYTPARNAPGHATPA